MSRIQIKPIQILIAHPQALVRAALSAIIEHHNDLDVFAEASDRERLESGIAEGGAAVTLVALDLLGPPPYTRLRALQNAYPDVRFVVLCQDESVEEQAEAIQAGARGLVGRSAPSNSLCEALRSAGRGLRWMESSLERYLSQRDAAPSQNFDFGALTPRERQVAALIARGETYQRIASELQISGHTVKNHVRHIFDKLDVNSRVELAVLTAGAVE